MPLYLFKNEKPYKKIKICDPMAQDNKIRLPSGQGGLTRYFDEYKSNTFGTRRTYPLF